MMCVFGFSDNPFQEHVKSLEVNNQTHNYFSLPDLKDDRYGKDRLFKLNLIV